MVLIAVVIGLLVGLGVGFGVLFFITQKQNQKQKETFSEEMEIQMQAIYPKLVEQLMMINREQLGAEKREIKTDLENKKNTIEMIVKEVRSELERSNRKLENAEKDRVGSFRALQEEIQQHRKITDQLSTTAEGLRKVLSNNQLRGQFGEQVAEDLLQMSGFVPGVDYVYNKGQEQNQNRPDFSVLLPNKVKVNVDVKFPYANLQKISETKDEQQRKVYEQKFREDIRQKIKQVTTRNYINPEENTVDFVILFIPNEMIFSYIYDKMNDIWTEAMRQKVVFAGPFSFTAILRLVRQAYVTYGYQNNVQKIIGHIKTFEEEFKNFSEEFLKIGKRIEDTARQFDVVKTTRYNQLTRRIEKVKLADEAEKPLLPTPLRESK